MDSYSEQIVRQPFDGKRMLIAVGVVVAAIALAGVTMLFLPPAFFMVAAGCGFGVYYVISSQCWEVEYIVTNGDIDIDRIVARRQRKTIVRVRGKKIEHLLPVKAGVPEKSFDRVVMAASSTAAATWYFTYHSKKSGSTIVYFEPNDRILEELRGGLSRTVLVETDRALREL